MQGKIMPHSNEAEKAILGACLVSQDSLYTALEKVKADEFYDRNHREIYACMENLVKANRPVDNITVAEMLKDRGELSMVGGRSYIDALSHATTTVCNIEEYANIINEKAALRKIIQFSEETENKGYSGMAAKDILDYAETNIFDLTSKGDIRKVESLQDVIIRNIEMIDEAAKDPGGLTGITSGFIDLDYKTSGFQDSDLIIVAARPAMGKTAFALSLAINAAKKGEKVLMFSLEMSKEQLGQRIISMESGVNMQKIKKGQVQRHWEDINNAINKIAQYKISIDDSPGAGVMEIKSKCRRQMMSEGLDLVIIDYLQLIDTKRAESRNQEISALSRNLKLMAKELDCPVIVLSQLSRAPEQRVDHRPMLSDLRESGSIEQDADMVILLYRDDYYNPESSEEKGICEVIVAKQRSGPVGTVKLCWVSECTKFLNAAREPEVGTFSQDEENSQVEW